MAYPWFKTNKFHNEKETIDGITFDSKKEASKYSELKWLQKLGKVSHLECQKKFELIPTQYELKNGKKVVVEKPVSYYADFYYFDEDKKCWVVCDTKSEITKKDKTYIIKRKLMRFIHNIAILEC